MPHPNPSGDGWRPAQLGWRRGQFRMFRSTLEQLGAGEREAIRLAEVTETAVVLLDGKKARRIARDRGLVVSGTLGVLDFAARRGLLDLPAARRSRTR